MLFQHTWENVVRRLKTQTSRIKKEWQILRADKHHGKATFSATGRLLYKVGGEYPVQRGRGCAGLWMSSDHQFSDGPPVASRILKPTDWYQPLVRVLNIREQDRRDISHADALAEGFQGEEDFLLTWGKMHDKPFIKIGWTLKLDIEDPAKSYLANEPFWLALLAQPVERYTGFVYDFELVRQVKIVGHKLP